ncbi:integration host factor (IHF), alpha subunit, DNA-binding protein, DNA replication [Crenothrix polyspora]|uniref:Integration host factor subunit alpha n=1 Tax=Crenothrix polyspora TaxID=360316 RepID=A0A1R4H3W4_9GAMM|nr:integration host factor subunit alpha [Crenothrix polyspora]SJM90867.1 integration host factor (IHF), alpha subunit, DNA-binding protein, DNA replication [Crenothrix polyspora]
MVLTKAVFAEKLMDEMDLTKDEAKSLVELFFGEIKDTLEQGESVKLSGFGKFELRDKAGRPGRNPKTGEDIPITPRRVVTFRVGNKLKGRIKNATEAE